jgi:hypothetical protein
VRKIVKEKMMTSQAFLTCSNYDAEKTEWLEVDQNWKQSSPHITSRPMKNNLFVRINSLTSAGIMAAKKWCSDNEEGLRNLVKSVFDSDNECRDSSEDETESEVSSIGSDDE